MDQRLILSHRMYRGSQPSLAPEAHCRHWKRMCLRLTDEYKLEYDAFEL